MHHSSFENMKSFRQKRLGGRENEQLLILDLGSSDINGSYRPLFEEPKWIYRGIDLQEGENVDIILQNPYRFKKIKSHSIDVFISGQTFEHIEYFWLTMLEIARVLKTGGLCCLIAPSGGYEHRYPVDCWRFFPDGLRALARFARLVVKDVYVQKDIRSYYSDESNLWKDAVLVCQKPKWSLTSIIKSRMSSWFMGYLTPK